MESLSPQVVSAAKLPILNPNEFDLWKMRIEQYFLMTDYSLWEVILNGDSPGPTRVIEGVLHPVAPTTAEQRLARKNELKACVSAAASVSVVSAKIPVSALPNMDSLSNAVNYSFFASQSNRPQLDNDDLKQIDADDLEEMDLKWQMAMLTVECYNYHRKGHFARECWSPKDTRRNGAVEPQRRNVPVDSSTSNAFGFPMYQSGNGYHVVPPPYTGTFMPPKPDLVFHNAPNDVETVHPAFNVELSLTKPKHDWSHTHRPSAPIIENWHVETSIPTANTKSAIPKPTSNGDRRNRKACFVCKSLDHLIKDCDYHEKKMAQTTARTHAQRGNHKQYARMTLPNPQRHVVPPAVLPQSKLVPITAVRPVSTAVPKLSVTRPRQAKTVVTKSNSPPRRHITHSPSPKAINFSPKVTAVKAPMVNA
uniref:CCHC-type domain-containing protein n=1 Tax=Tanacetum cinerariifolium TaxID=118510 RepID=A0A699I0S8_TANCI|nr:hypothetical protein [Tanacetum cinerariifolium]